MLNFRQGISVLGFLVLLSSCKTPEYLFNENRIVQDSVISNISLLLGGQKKDPITGYKIYHAIIQEKLVESNAVAEYKLMNSLSNKKAVDLAINRYANELYFYEIHSVNRQTYGIFLAATFETPRKCIGIGPLYMGFVGVGEYGTKKFTVQSEYAIVNESTTSLPSIRKKRSFPELVFSYAPEMSPPGITITHIIQKNKNKISGMNKPVVYDIEQIFNDRNALRFSLVN